MPKLSAFPPTPRPYESRLERELDRSLYAENIARELAFAVYRTPWHALETWQQLRLRNTAVLAIRSLDPYATAVARSKAVEAFEDDRSGTTVDRVGSALGAFHAHLMMGADEAQPTPEQDAAYRRYTETPLDPRD